MAYVSPELKAALSPTIKAICKKYGVKASIAVDRRMSLVLNIKSGPIDFLASYHKKMKALNSDMGRGYIKETKYIQVNTYHHDRHFDGKALEFLTAVLKAMNVGNYDKSDSQSDYFNCGWYVDVNVGKYNAPYVLVK
jgi:hypothetical protein